MCIRDSYYCAASYTSLTGALCVDSGVEHANAAAARESILKELAALCAGPVAVSYTHLDVYKRQHI